MQLLTSKPIFCDEYYQSGVTQSLLWYSNYASCFDSGKFSKKNAHSFSSLVEISRRSFWEFGGRNILGEFVEPSISLHCAEKFTTQVASFLLHSIIANFCENKVEVTWYPIVKTNSNYPLNVRNWRSVKPSVEPRMTTQKHLIVLNVKWLPCLTLIC